MTSGIDFSQEYHQAEKAYMQSDFQKAAAIIDRLVESYPDNPSALLLKGHIYCGLQHYDTAREQYQQVLNITTEPEFLDYAHNGLHYVDSVESSLNYAQGSEEEGLDPYGSDYGEYGEVAPDIASEAAAAENWQSLADLEDFNVELDNFDGLDSVGNGVSSAEFDLHQFDQGLEEADNLAWNSSQDTPFASDDPFAVPSTEHNEDLSQYSDDPFTADLGAFAAGDDFHISQDDPFADLGNQDLHNSGSDQSLGAFDLDEHPFSLGEPDDLHNPLESPGMGAGQAFAPFEDETLLMRSGELEDTFASSAPHDGRSSFDSPSSSNAFDSTESLGRGFGHAPSSNPLEDATFVSSGSPQGGGLDQFDFSAFDDDLPETNDYLDHPSHIGEDFPGSSSNGHVNGNGSNGTFHERPADDFLDSFGEFDDLGNIPDFSLGHGDASDDLSNHNRGFSFTQGNTTGSTMSDWTAPSTGDLTIPSGILETDDREVFSITGTSEQVPTFTPVEVTKVETAANVEQGWLGFFENQPLTKKPMILAALAGVASALVVAATSYVSASVVPSSNKAETVGYLRGTSWVMSLTAGLASFGTTLFLSRTMTRQIKRATDDLQAQFEQVVQGNFNAQATVYSEDEFGALAAGFNHMARVILATTSEAQRKAEEQEQAKEDLQRQVIRLLDDVEGAARGDLTVQAEVTADVLGAVADSFNLTIQNLREIVQQVKRAAQQVNKGSTDSESFARGLASDALRQAEELAVTLNSVQVMTDLIQRVAESAREAEEVARTASATALKGGEAVERTVAGILQIRETVAETSRKVKRLAESSQEISKIVALISSIASRTNLLALNASIEAARAGEAGRGFAVVADEVRQLADRAAKASKEIEQIVLQIQSETSSVMTAMEEGTQQVLDGTRRAEQAKKSLEDIIQVSNRIDALVRSITADTVEQSETSRAVAQVMQAVELTAQETSQESQRVSGALQGLVGVARDLLTSVERFRVESTEVK